MVIVSECTLATWYFIWLLVDLPDLSKKMYLCSFYRNDLRPNLLLTSTEDEVTHSPDRSPAAQSSNLAGDWEILEVYLVSNF